MPPQSKHIFQAIESRDAAIFGAIRSELCRQRDEIELIALRILCSRCS